MTQYYLRFVKVFVKILPVKEPLMKLTPIIKAIGNLTVWLEIKFTFLLSELFCIPTISSKNKEKLNKITKIIFFKTINNF